MAVRIKAVSVGPVGFEESVTRIYKLQKEWLVK